MIYTYIIHISILFLKNSQDERNAGQNGHVLAALRPGSVRPARPAIDREAPRTGSSEACEINCIGYTSQGVWQADGRGGGGSGGAGPSGESVGDNQSFQPAVSDGIYEGCAGEYWEFVKSEKLCGGADAGRSVRRGGGFYIL